MFYRLLIGTIGLFYVNESRKIVKSHRLKSQVLFCPLGLHTDEISAHIFLLLEDLPV